MFTHIDLLRSMPTVRAAVVGQFAHFIHATPVLNFDGIKENGLLPMRDMAPPPEVVAELGQLAGNILCLHPLGAELTPRGTKPPPLMMMAVAAQDLPARICMDWSYSWEIVEGRMRLYQNMTVPEFVLKIATEFGSVVSYDRVPPDRIKVLCAGEDPSDPSGWSSLTNADVSNVVQHD